MDHKMKLSQLIYQLQEAYEGYGEKDVVVDCSSSICYEKAPDYKNIEIYDTEIIFGNRKEGKTQSAKMYINCC